MAQWTEQKPLRVATGFTYVYVSYSTNVSNLHICGTVCTACFLKEKV